MVERLKQCRRRVVGTKETLKAVEKNEARVVFVARDADEKVTRPVADLCRDRGVEIQSVERLRELGKWCGIKIGAATAAIIEQ